MKTLKLWLLIPLLVCSTLFVSTGLADVLAVTNFSFETLPAGGLPFDSCGAGCFFSEDAIPGWVSGSGQFQPGTQDGNFSFFDSLSDGITSAFSNQGTTFQTVGATVEPGVVYTLQVDIGQRNDLAFAGTADLLINGITYAATGSTPPAGSWGTFTATYTGLLADLGDPITIELKSSGQEGNFDNVRLTDSLGSSAVPEVNSFTLLGTVVLGIGMWRRRQSSRR